MDSIAVNKSEREDRLRGYHGHGAFILGQFLRPTRLQPLFLHRKNAFLRVAMQ